MGEKSINWYVQLLRKKNSKKVFVIVYFHLRFSSYNINITQVDKY